MDEDRRSWLADSARANRREFSVHVLVGTAVAIGLITLGTFIGLPPHLSGGLALAAVVGIGGWYRNQQTGEPPDRIDRTGPLTGADSDGVRLTNFAFSEAEPTWRGWHRDVGDVTVHPERIVVDGLSDQLVLYPPFTAELHDGRWIHWAMVKITATTDSGDPATVYLVGKGAPKSLYAGRPEDVRNSGVALIAEINIMNAG